LRPSDSEVVGAGYTAAHLNSPSTGAPSSSWSGLLLPPLP
jgi:hypothetical protein